MKHILFVCTGNTCRSSMAEGIFNATVKSEDELSGQVCASSAGISAFDGDGASSNAVRVLKDDWGIDISSHRSKAVDDSMIQAADLILTMTRAHKEAILSRHPLAGCSRSGLAKVFTLKEFTMDGCKDNNIEEYNYALDIIDPFGMSAQVYRRCANEIKNSIDFLIQKLKKDM